MPRVCKQTAGVCAGLASDEARGTAESGVRFVWGESARPAADRQLQMFVRIDVVKRRPVAFHALGTALLPSSDLSRTQQCWRAWKSRARLKLFDVDTVTSC